jgi:short-subunit dehydrogenase
MSLYRASPADGVAWITGASSGIGRRLSLDLAAAGYAVAATARDAGGLETLAREAEGLAGRVVTLPADVADREAMADCVRRIEQEVGPIVLAVFNAGLYLPVGVQNLSRRKFQRTFEVNVIGVVNGLCPVIERMKERGRGQVAIVGSLTSYRGLPTAAAYGASKAALVSMAESLKFDLDPLNIRVQVINPGFVATPMTAKNSFAMPALLPVEEASRRIVRGLASGGFEIAFPRRLSWALGLAARLPYGLFFPVMKRLTGWDRGRR